MIMEVIFIIEFDQRLAEMTNFGNPGYPLSITLIVIGDRYLCCVMSVHAPGPFARIDGPR